MRHADLIRGVHRTNGIVAFSYGLLVNILLIFMVLRSNLKSYKRLLLQMSFVDCTFLILSGLVDPIVTFVDGTELIFHNSFLRKVPQPLNLILISAWAFGLYFTVFSICVQFLFRYFVIVKSTEVSNRTLLTMMAVPMAPAGIVAWLVMLGFPYTPADERYFTNLLHDMLVETGEDTFGPGGIAHSGNVPLQILISLAFTFMVTNYSIIVFCIVKINKRLHQISEHLTVATRSLHQQLNIVLIVQACLPLAFSVLPLLFVFWCIVSHGTALLSLMPLTMCFAWIPSINATVALIFVKQFRRRIAILLGIGLGAQKSFTERTSIFVKKHRNRVHPSHSGEENDGTEEEDW